jgi:hypothetical protein
LGGGSTPSGSLNSSCCPMPAIGSHSARPQIADESNHLRSAIVGARQESVEGKL